MKGLICSPHSLAFHSGLAVWSSSMKAVCQLVGLILLPTLALAVLGVAAFIGVGALLARWLPLSLFQASALAIGATMATALVILVVMVIMLLQTVHSGQDDDFDWEFEEDEGNDTLLSTPNIPKIGRNEPCPCGSGKKFKNCCGKTTPT